MWFCLLPINRALTISSLNRVDKYPTPVTPRISASRRILVKNDSFQARIGQNVSSYLAFAAILPDQEASQ